MLDTCGGLIDEIGYDRLTTTMIAERAGIAIGSLYQFFPDKRAIAQALLLRSLNTYTQRLNERLADDGLTHWWDGVAAAIDEYITLHRTVPGIRILHHPNVVDAHALDAVGDNNIVLADQLARALIERFAIADTPRMRLTLKIVVATSGALTTLAFRRQPDGDEKVLSEAKELIRDYLQRQLASHG
ncbi:TetR/AcrR family transcriptional regulator [Micromonospora sp. NPDC048930]|uniref:TetR/AcrR family transcriptional regulator n=1 Tax=Micromonospora sp. NPDC048930 TaxID=3364261 RepID=UPI0037127903